MSAITTIGYEAASLEAFLATLQLANVRRLVDVRAVALSRRPSFSKKALAHHLASQGIDYVHIQALGDPKAGRIAAYEGRYADFRRIYRLHLKTSAAQAGLESAAGIVSEAKACLLCYERDASTCHRSLVAEALAGRTGLAVEHLRVDADGARPSERFG